MEEKEEEEKEGNCWEFCCQRTMQQPYSHYSCCCCSAAAAAVVVFLSATRLFEFSRFLVGNVPAAEVANQIPTQAFLPLLLLWQAPVSVDGLPAEHSPAFLLPARALPSL